MQELQNILAAQAGKALLELYALADEKPELQPTRKEFEGDLTLVVFPYLRASKQKPEQTAEEIGAYLQKHVTEVAAYNVVKGFLNLVIDDAFWIKQVEEVASQENYGFKPKGEETVLIEYSSPNTNKPLHLGHIRNILLGYSMAEILSAAGKNTKKVQIINDRGIHICKSMLAWKKFGKGETPESTGMKGDHLVGKYYVEFDKAFKSEVEALKAKGLTDDEANAQSGMMREAREMLQRWEAGDPETVKLWETMNGWVYSGFNKTYDRLGVNFDKNYYESQTYLLGKKIVLQGVEDGVFFRKDDGSVWCDLEEEKLGEKLLLRKDGTSVYMTQDIGTAIQRYEDFGIDGMIYTVGNEQDYHFQVLFAILKKLGYKWAENLYHLSYGMVDLPTGKMKSREGTVVDADDLINEMEQTAEKISEELGKTEGMSEAQKKELYHMVGLGALKYYILRVDPRKRMLFNPEESVDFQGDTGPFIQYTHARIKSLLRKAEGIDFGGEYHGLHERERELVKLLLQWPEKLSEAAGSYSPSTIAGYVYDLVKSYNALYQQLPILADDDKGAIAFRVKLSEQVAEVVKNGMMLLGIEVPERM